MAQKRWSWQRLVNFVNFAGGIASIIALGGAAVLTAVTGAAATAIRLSRFIPQPWFALAAAGVFLLFVALLLAIAHRVQRWFREREGAQPTPPAVVVRGHQFGKSEGASESIESDLLRLATERLGEIPLRRCETLIVVHILRDAIQSLDKLPLTGNSAVDVKFTGQRRKCSQPEAGEQMWHLPTTVKGLCEQGIILSDQTLDTLTDLHDRLMKLRRDVYDRYHPPTLPGSSRARPSNQEN